MGLGSLVLGVGVEGVDVFLDLHFVLVLLLFGLPDLLSLLVDVVNCLINLAFSIGDFSSVLSDSLFSGSFLLLNLLLEVLNRFVKLSSLLSINSISSINVGDILVDVLSLISVDLLLVVKLSQFFFS